HFYVNGTPLPYPIAESGPSAQNLGLTFQAKAAGWKMEGSGSGAKLKAPDAVKNTPARPDQLQGLKVSFNVLLDGQQKQAITIAYNQVAEVDLGPVPKGTHKVTLKPSGQPDVRKFGLESQFEVSKPPAGPEQAAEKPPEAKP